MISENYATCLGTILLIMSDIKHVDESMKQLGNHNAKKFKQYHHLYFGLATKYIKINNQNVLYIKVTRIYIYTYNYKEGCKINHNKISSK